MTNPTPRDSAQLPPHFMPPGFFYGVHAKFIQDYAEAYAREALRAQALTAPNLACKSAQARLATQWGYVRAASVEPDPMDHRTEDCEVCQSYRTATSPPAHIPADDWHLRSRVQDLLHLLSFAEITTPSPGDKPEAEKAMADIRAMLNKPQPVAASPATAVDSVDEAALFDDWARDNVMRDYSNSDRHFMRWGWNARAALQASRQPQAQQAVAEGAGDEHMWSFDPMIDAALATKEQSS